MDRQLLLGSTVCFLVAVAHTAATLREGVFRPRRFNFVAIAAGFALLAPIDVPHPVRVAVNPWLEFHASISMIAYGAFALACVAGVMYLVQERQLKTHQLHSIFYHLPPLTSLFSALTRLLWLGFALYTAGLISGFFTGGPLPRLKMICAFAVWIFYGVILQGRHLHKVAPKRIAALCILAFTAAVSVLWAINFVSETRPT